MIVSLLIWWLCLWPWSIYWPDDCVSDLGLSTDLMIVSLTLVYLLTWWLCLWPWSIYWSDDCVSDLGLSADLMIVSLTSSYLLIWWLCLWLWPIYWPDDCVSDNNLSSDLIIVSLNLGLSADLMIVSLTLVYLLIWWLCLWLWPIYWPDDCVSELGLSTDLMIVSLSLVYLLTWWFYLWPWPIYWPDDCASEWPQGTEWVCPAWFWWKFEAGNHCHRNRSECEVSEAEKRKDWEVLIPNWWKAHALNHVIVTIYVILHCVQLKIQNYKKIKSMFVVPMKTLHSRSTWTFLEVNFVNKVDIIIYNKYIYLYTSL